MTKRTKKKHLLWGLLFMTALGICFFKTNNVYAAVMTSAQLQEKFPNGKYWNHAGNPGSSNNKNNQDGYTSTPCNRHGTVGTSKQTCNGFAPNGKQLAWQCMGFAEKMGYDFTGSNPRENQNGWNTSYSRASLNSLKAGDIVRYKNNGHSIFVTAVHGNSVSYADCNSDGHCRICWNKTIQKTTLRASFTYVRCAPYELPTGNIQPSSDTSNYSMPYITNVGIDSISSKHITFHFKACNAALAKIVIESRNTGKSISYTYTSGLDNISQYFYAGIMPGTTEMNIRIYAYSTAEGGNETLHNVLYGNTPDVVKLPQEYAAIEELCFDPVFYADVNTDARYIYGYDEAALYYHWVTFGIKEGRNSSPAFDVKYYLKTNTDIKNAYGMDYMAAYQHFLTNGCKEYRNSSVYYDGRYYQSKYYGEFKDMDSRQLLLHFKNYGIWEGRCAGSEIYTGNSSWKK